MEWRDLAVFAGSLVSILLTQMVMRAVTGGAFEDSDFTEAVVIAGMATVIFAVREKRAR